MNAWEIINQVFTDNPILAKYIELDKLNKAHLQGIPIYDLCEKEDKNMYIIPNRIKIPNAIIDNIYDKYRDKFDNSILLDLKSLIEIHTKCKLKCISLQIKLAMLDSMETTG